MSGVMITVAVLVIGGAENPGVTGLRRCLEAHGARVLVWDAAPDDRDAIRRQLLRLCEHAEVQAVFTVGGTGVRPTDWAPEATRDILEKEIPGLGEAMRAESMKTVKTAMLSRGTAGIRGGTLVVNLPGSPKGAMDNLSTVLPLLDHAVGKITGSRPADAGHGFVDRRRT